MSEDLSSTRQIEKITLDDEHRVFLNVTPWFLIFFGVKNV